MDKPEAFLTYHFQFFVFRFIEDYLLIYDKINKREYKMIFNNPYGSEIPFMYTLERQD